MEKNKQIQRNWHIFDASTAPVGRVCTEVASLIIGKHKPSFAKNIDGGDHVVVINSDKLYLTGNKENSKQYHTHSGYIGSTKTLEFKEAKEKKSDMIIKKAVAGMLPKNKQTKSRLARLHVYKSDKHLHQNIKFENE